MTDSHLSVPKRRSFHMVRCSSCRSLVPAPYANFLVFVLLDTGTPCSEEGTEQRSRKLTQRTLHNLIHFHPACSNRGGTAKQLLRAGKLVNRFHKSCVDLYLANLKLKVGRTPACVKTFNSQGTMSATWRKESSTVETNEIMKTAAHRSESWCWHQLLSHVSMLVLTLVVCGRPNTAWEYRRHRIHVCGRRWRM
jgi:hypothetical protein